MKSKRADPAVERGTSSLGKKTFETSAEFATNEPEPRLITLLTRLNTSIPAKVYRMGGTPPLGSLATLLKTKVSTPAASNGWRMTQITPSAVWR
jgi:hypothetical protein